MVPGNVVSAAAVCSLLYLALTAANMSWNYVVSPVEPAKTRRDLDRTASASRLRLLLSNQIVQAFASRLLPIASLALYFLS